MKSTLKHNQIALVESVFTPTSPIYEKNRFIGRFEQLRTVLKACREPGQHILVFGDRGVGKSSLANVILSQIPGHLVVKINCNRSANFSTTWREIFQEIITHAQSGDKRIKPQSVDLALFQQTVQQKLIDQNAVKRCLKVLKTPLVIILDEYDVIARGKTLGLFADTFKAISDNLPHVTAVIVGIAHSASQLIGQHPSLERCLAQIYVPRMPDNELRDIIESGLQKLKMSMDPQVKEDIVRFSMGLPFYTHSLVKAAALDALEKRYPHIVKVNFEAAIQQAMDSAQASLLERYRLATDGSATLFPHLVHASAICGGNEIGAFTPNDLQAILQEVAGKEVPLKQFAFLLSKLTLESRGELLEKVEHPRLRLYRYKHPVMKAFIRLKLYREGIYKIRRKTRLKRPS